MVLLVVARVLRLQCSFIGPVMKVGWFSMSQEARNGVMEAFSINIQKRVFGTHLFKLKIFSRQEHDLPSLLLQSDREFYMMWWTTFNLCLDYSDFSSPNNKREENKRRGSSNNDDLLLYLDTIYFIHQTKTWAHMWTCLIYDYYGKADFI